ncbi:MAG: type II and III secretion system protein family protein [Dongiaceae bacterium]
MNILRSGAASAIALLMLTVAPGPLMSVAEAQQVTRVTSGNALSIQVNQGQLVRIDKPVQSVFVANSEIADVAVKSAQLIYVFGKRPGTTTLYAVGEGDEILASVTLTITHNLSRLDQTIAEMMPGRNITATSIEGGIVLNGAVSSPGEAEDARRLAARFIGANEEVINRLQVTAPNQVNVRVRIAEVNKQVLRNLGINWDVAIQQGGFAFGLLTAFPLGLSNVVAGGTSGATTPTVSTGPLDLTATMDLLAEEGLVSLLAEPNLTALSGETATFLAGGEFPIPVSQDTDTITIEFRQFGVSLAFTPTILSPNRISMRVRPEVSALSADGAINTPNGLSIPALTVRRAETTVELASGQTFAVAGLVQNTNRITADEIPGLGDIPVLGELFKSDKFQHNETELVIMATPYVVQPISNPNAPALPTDPVMGAEGTQRLAGAPGAAAGASGQAGFVIE